MEPDWSMRKRKQPGLFLLMSAAYGMFAHLATSVRDRSPTPLYAYWPATVAGPSQMQLLDLGVTVRPVP